MDQEISHLIKEVTLKEQETEPVTLVCYVPEARIHFQKLLDGATQATLTFVEGEWEEKPVIGFQLQNANGVFFLVLESKDWLLLDEQPEQLTFIYGEKKQDQFTVPFLNRVLDQFIEDAIERYNQNDQTAFVQEIISVFAQEE